MKVHYLGMLICSLGMLYCAAYHPAGLPIELQSPDFPENGFIPCRYTCDCEEMSPTLEWEEGPDNTQSYAIIVTDPDAPIPFITVTHWIIYNIPAGFNSFPEGVSAE